MFVLLALLLPGCAGMKTEGANFLLDVHVSGDVNNGAATEAGSDQVVVIPPNAQFPDAFPAKAYWGSRFRWRFGVGASGIGGELENRTGASLCARFDRARISSNYQTEPAPLMVSSVIHAQKGNRDWHVRRPQTREPTTFVAPKLCFTPGQSEYFSVSPDASALFPSGKLFNIRFDGVPSGQGKGNWLRLDIPIDVEGRTETFTVTFTARDSKLTVSYH